jgi:hypothetical protein
LVRKEPCKLDWHRIGVQPAQVNFVRSCRSGDDFSPEHGPSLIEGLKKPTHPIIIELLGVVHIAVQGRNVILRGPSRHIVERPGIRQSALDHQLRHQAVVKIGLLSHRAQLINRLTQAQATQKRGRED